MAEYGWFIAAFVLGVIGFLVVWVRFPELRDWNSEESWKDPRSDDVKPDPRPSRSDLEKRRYRRKRNGVDEP